QAAHGALGVAVLGAAHQVVGGQQDLRGGQRVPGELGGVAGQQQPLADAGRGLLGGQVAGAAGEAQRGHSGGDGSGGDEHHFGSGGAACRQHVGEVADAVVVDASLRGGEGG